jgi:hypothetical protein
VPVRGVTVAQQSSYYALYNKNEETSGVVEEKGMAGRDNIVQILRNDLFEHAGRISEADIPELIHSAKRIASKELQVLLQKMFDNVDDCLFEYADKADNNQQQMRYFDAMREVRLQKDAMAAGFHREFDKLFKLEICGDSSTTGDIHAGTVGDTCASLSLVEEDDLELSLAVSNMVTKIQSLYREPISALVQRMDYVLNGIGLDSEHFLLSGKVICESFEAAINTLNADVQVKLIIYKLFDKFVVQNLGRIYNDVNAMFVAAGVLPQIKIRAPVNRGSTRRRESDLGGNEMLAELQDTLLHPEGQATEFEGGNVFNVMQQLLLRARSAGFIPQGVTHAIPAAGNEPGCDSDTCSNAGAVNTMPVLSTASSTPGLSNPGLSTPELSTPGLSTPGLSTPGLSTPGLSTYVAQDVISGLSGIQQRAGVSFLNDGFLNNKQQQPSGELIKTVLVKELSKNGEEGNAKSIDRTESDAIDIVSMLFDFILGDKTLPDRLKALIARLQIPLVKVAILDNSFFGKKAHPARQLLNELAYAGGGSEDGLDGGDDSLYETVEDIVDRVLTGFESDVSIFEVLLKEWREYLEKEYEANRMAEAMLEQTKDKVIGEIEHRLRNNRVPDTVGRLLLEQWKDVMTVIGVRDGVEGDGWDAAIHLMDDLIWSVQPKLVVQEKSQLTRVIPRILNGLQEGLMLIDYGQDNIQVLFEKLEQLHHESLRGLLEVGIKRDPDQFQDVEEIVLQDESLSEDFIFHPVDPALAKSEYYYLVKGLETGSWLEFVSQDQRRRGKLAWKCDFTNDYTFVDRRYKLVADISMAELIQRLEEGSVKVIDEVPLFDRAIDAVLKGMKQYLSSGDELKGSASVN